MPRKGRKSRARRVLGVLGAVVATSVTFVVGTAAAAVVHLDAPVTRRLVATQATRILHEQFAGDVAIEYIGSLGLRGISGVRFRVKDPAGVQVLFVSGAQVRVRALVAARSALFDKGDILVPVDLVSIDHVDVSIDGDAAGNLRIANAFGARTITPSKPTEPGARGVRVDGREIRLKSAWVHGQAPGAPPVDGELHDLGGHAHYDAKLTEAVLDHVGLVTRGLPRGVDPHGSLGGQFRMPSRAGKDMSVEAAFDGVVAGIPTGAHFRLDGTRVDAVVDGRDPSGRGVRATFGEVSIKEEVTLHAEAHGELPSFDANAHVAVGRGTVDVKGHVDTSDGTKAHATIGVRHVDLHGIVAAAPASDVGLDTRVDVVIAKSGELNGDVVLETIPGRVAGEALPILNLRGQFTKHTAHADGRIVDPRATADFDVGFDGRGGGSRLEGRLDAEVKDLSRLPPVGARMKGRATLEAKAALDLGSKDLSARAHVVAGGLGYGAQSVDNATLLATARGTMDRPIIDVGVHAGRLASGEQRIEVADIRARVTPGRVTIIDDAHVDLVRNGRTVSVAARRAELGGPRLAIQGVSVVGLGEPLLADLSRDRNEVRIKVDGPAIDLPRVALLAGKPDAVTSGRLAIKGDVVLRPDSASGDLRVDVDGLTTKQVEGGKAHLEGHVAGGVVQLAMKAELGATGTFELAAGNVAIEGSPVKAASWARARGRAKFSGNLDMAKLASLVPKDLLPVSELTGGLVVAGTIRRDSGDVPPELSVHAHTRGLLVAGRGPAEPSEDPTHGPRVTAVQPWRSAGVDVSFDARVDATSGFGEVSLHAIDAKGTLVGFDAKSNLPYEQMLADPQQVLALLQDAPLNARLVVPKRALADLPAFAGTGRLPGTVEAELDLHGTVRKPQLTLVAHARNVRSPALSAQMSSNVDVTLEYDGEKAELVATADTEKHRAVEVGARLDLRSADVFENAGQPLAWGGSARVKLDRFSMETLNPLAERRIRGRVTGDIVIEELHKNAAMKARLVLDGLRIGRAAYKSGNIVVVAGDGKLTAGARLEQTDGYADLQATTGLAWGQALVPALDPKADATAHLEAKAFRAAALLPFVQRQLNTLDGRIDANATVKVGPGFKDPVMEGDVAFHDGTVQIAGVGEEYKNARAKISFKPGVIAIDDVFMAGTEGELTASAVVKTRGLALDSATGELHIPKRKPLDLALQGQPFGAVSGDVKVAATNSQDGKTLKVEVDVPALNLALPAKIKSGVQELSEKQNIRIGVFRDPKTFVTLPLDQEDLEPPSAEKPETTTVEITTKLGEITLVQGNQARVVLTGSPRIALGAKTQVTGQIEVKEGKVEVQGKTFEIEKGTITFQPEDPANPIVVATAEWTADDGTQVYADFVGPVKTGKVTLRSDPPRPRNEVLAIILFGTADGANAPPSGGHTDGTTAAAVGVGGGVAAQGLTQAMDDLTGIQARAKIDTSRSANPAPEIEIQLARRLSISFAHVLGTPPISEPDTNLATIDWRFRRNWTLETTVGDRGLLQTDAVWQKRY